MAPRLPPPAFAPPPQGFTACSSIEMHDAGLFLAHFHSTPHSSHALPFLRYAALAGSTACFTVRRLSRGSPLVFFCVIKADRGAFTAYRPFPSPARHIACSATRIVFGPSPPVSHHVSPNATPATPTAPPTPSPSARPSCLDIEYKTFWVHHFCGTGQHICASLRPPTRQFLSQLEQLPITDQFQSVDDTGW
ncbi:hypothetical protein DFH09DRAFT_1086378 [Mycena vulgaris]|nr:hypothetical protein DFH09DRAFT_1086378 [Mycena vulgaris]